MVEFNHHQHQGGLEGIEDTDECIAIIGMDGRFPKSENVEQLWQHLLNGEELISDFSEEQYLELGGNSIFLNDPNLVRKSPYLEDTDLFDAHFFDISPRDAELLDPQHRLMLEVCYQALERAGYANAKYRGRTALYLSVGISHYLLNNLLLSGAMQSHGYLPLVFASDKDYVPTRISYKLNLRGPSVNVNTACSSSLVATHIACLSLLNFEADIALAGGVSLQGLTGPGYLYQQGGIASPDGHCRSFDAQAQGTVPGSGLGCMVLKRYNDAIEAGDTISAVILASAINNDGSDKVGYTAPSVSGQALAIKQALLNADIEPQSIRYVEAHGTATSLGDPIEISALTRAYDTEAKNYCAIGSIKSNLGHLDAAAGVAGLIKTALVLKNKKVPASLHYQSPNPQVDFENSPFYVAAEPIDLSTEKRDEPLRAAVSSFGIGGTNAHAILQAAPGTAARADVDSALPVVLSAKSRSALQQLAQNLSQYLQDHPQLALQDIAFTCAVGREDLPFRRSISAASRGQLIDVLKQAPASDVLSDNVEEHDALVMMFSGQGEQYVGMGQDLYKQYPVFRDSLDLCAKKLRAFTDIDLIRFIYPNGACDSEGGKSSDGMQNTRVAQLALFCFEYSLVQLLQAWKIKAKALVGHSLGECVAACIAGVLDLDEALRFVESRARCMAKIAPGSMLAVNVDEQRAKQIIQQNDCDKDCALAAVNAPEQAVLAGPIKKIRKIQQQLESAGTQCQLLANSYAFHSPMVDSILDAFYQEIENIQFKVPTVPFVSNVTGEWISPEQACSPQYWCDHIRNTVRFRDAIDTLCKADYKSFLEVGPGKVLSSLSKLYFTSQEPVDNKGPYYTMATVRSQKNDDSDVLVLNGALGKLWQSGFAMDWMPYFSDFAPQRIALPTYPFERQRFWIDANGAVNQDTLQSAGRYRKIDQWFSSVSWKKKALSESLDSAARETLAMQEGRLCHLIVSDGSDWAQNLITHWQRNMRALYGDDSVLVEVQLDEVPRNTADQVYFKHAQKEGMQHFIIDAQDKKAYELLFASLSEMSLKVATISHVAAAAAKFTTAAANNADECIGADFIDTDITQYRRGQALSFYSLMYLAQILGPNAEASLCVLSAGVQSVLGHEPLSPEHATLIGAALVIPVECHSLRFCLLDIELLDTSHGYSRFGKSTGNVKGINSALIQHRPDAERCAQYIVNEFNRFLPDRLVAYRYDQRWVREVEQVNVPETSKHSAPLRKGGVYLFSGGLGGMGLQLASYCAEHFQPTLVLLVRSEFPPQDQWPQLLEDKQVTDARKEKVRTLQKILAQGAQLEIVNADVANAQQMAQAVSQVEEKHGPINGVIHAAGVPGGGIIPLKTKSMADAVFKPKIYGALVLYQLFKEAKLDFMLFCSSQDSIVGAFGQLDYCAANAFLDSMSDALHQQYRRGQLAYPVQAINWDAWKEVGMAAEAEVPENMREQRQQVLASAILNKEGCEVFHRVLGQKRLNQLIISTVRLVYKQQEVEKLKHLLAARSERTSKASHPRPELSQEYVEPRNDTERKLEEIWKSCLGFECIGIHDNFFDLGGESLVGMTLIDKTQKVFGETFHVTALFEAPTIAEFARYYQDLYQDEEDEEEEAQAIDQTMIEGYRQFVSNRSLTFPKADYKSPGSCFILCSPRTGSTLLRVILAGNPGIFAPPEMELLHFNTLRERNDILGSDNALLDGTTEAIMNIKQCSADEANILYQELVDQQLSVHDFYSLLNDWLGDQVLVEKSPTYAANMEILKRIENGFSEAKYIHLVRHPYAMIQSYVKTKIDLLMDKREREQLPFTRRQLAELIWLVTELNIQQFLRSIPEQRKFLVRYEDLVSQPEAVSRKMCKFLQVSYDPNMVDVYQEKRNRMTAGVHKESRMLGDVNFHKHDNIDSSLAYSWRKHFSKDFLGEQTIEVMASYDYQTLKEMDAAEQRPVPTAQQIRCYALNKQDDGLPLLYLIHPVGGSIFCYQALAQSLQRKVALKAIEAPGIKTPGQCFTSLAQMAEIYAEAISLDSSTEKKKILLGGWSMGGVVAHEILGLLGRHGIEVNALFLLDSHVPNIEGIGLMRTDDLSLMYGLGLNFGVSQTELDKLCDYQSLEELFPKLHQLIIEHSPFLAGVSLTEQSLRTRFDVLKNNAEILHEYRFTIGSDQLTPHLFIATQANSERELQLSLGWPSVYPKGIRTENLDTDHQSIMNSSFCGAIGNAILSYVTENHD